MVWNLSDVSDESLRRELTQQYSVTNKTLHAMKWSFVFAAVSRIFPLLFGRKVLPLTNQCEMNSTLYWALECIEIGFIYQCIYMITSLDIIFVGGCSTVMAQFKIANHLLRNMDHTESTISHKQNIFIQRFLQLCR